jgi:hypothetical protein
MLMLENVDVRAISVVEDSMNAQVSNYPLQIEFPPRIEL